MGWFVFASKKKSSRGRSKSKKSAASPWRAKHTLLLLQAVLGVLALAALIVGWDNAQRYLEARIASKRLAPVKAEHVELIGVPDHVRDDIRRRVQQAVAQSVSDNPLAPSDLQAARTQVNADPWVKDVQRIERRRQTVRVYADYRKPVALVGADVDLYQAVDAEGYVVESGYRTRDLETLRKEHGLSIVVGVRTPSPGLGAKWDDAKLLSALELAQLITRQKYRNQVVAYDVSNRFPNGKLRIRLLTTQGQVYWGSEPGEEGSGENAASTKLGWLAQLHHDSLGSLDGHGRHTVVLDMGKFEIRSASY